MKPWRGWCLVDAEGNSLAGFVHNEEMKDDTKYRLPKGGRWAVVEVREVPSRRSRKARLIAAAPQLLAQLVRVANVLGCAGPPICNGKDALCTSCGVLSDLRKMGLTARRKDA